jgi:hypothetical protein
MLPGTDALGVKVRGGLTERSDAILRGMANRVAAAVALMVLLGIAAASAQTPPTPDTTPIALTPTDRCPQADIDTLQRVIAFVRSQSWAEKPGSTAFLLNPDTTACRVVLTIEENRLSDAETAALQRGGENRLSIEERKDRAEASRLPLLLWVVFGGAGLVFVYARYGRR